MEKYTYTFDDGLKVEGSVEQILHIAKSLGKIIDLDKLPTPKGYYYSTSKMELVKIKDMPSMHIRNALCLSVKNYYEALGKSRALMDKEFTKKFIQMPEDPIIKDLYNELALR